MNLDDTHRRISMLASRYFPRLASEITIIEYQRHVKRIERLSVSRQKYNALLSEIVPILYFSMGFILRFIHNND